MAPASVTISRRVEAKEAGNEAIRPQKVRVRLGRDGRDGGGRQVVYAPAPAKLHLSSHSQRKSLRMPTIVRHCFSVSMLLQLAIFYQLYNAEYVLSDSFLPHGVYGGGSATTTYEGFIETRRQLGSNSRVHLERRMFKAVKRQDTTDSLWLTLLTLSDYGWVLGGCTLDVTLLRAKQWQAPSASNGTQRLQ